MKCSSALCLEVVPLTPSLLFATCRRSTSPLTNCSTLPSFTLRKPWMSKEGQMVDPNELGGRGMGCACHPGHVLQCPESCVGQWSVQWGVGVGVGVHQGSVLSPLLFILVLEALSCEFCTDVPWDLLYANNDLVLIVDTLEECLQAQGLEGWYGE